jgi:hypothetical protein
MSQLPPAPIDPSTGAILCPYPPESITASSQAQPAVGQAGATGGLAEPPVAAPALSAMPATQSMLDAARAAASDSQCHGIVTAINAVTAVLSRIESAISSQIARAQSTCDTCHGSCCGQISRILDLAEQKVGRCCNKVMDQITRMLAEAQARVYSTAPGQEYLRQQQEAALQAAGAPQSLASQAASTVGIGATAQGPLITTPPALAGLNIGELATALSIALYPLAEAIGQLARAAAGQPIPQAAPMGEEEAAARKRLRDLLVPPLTEDEFPQSPGYDVGTPPLTVYGQPPPPTNGAAYPPGGGAAPGAPQTPEEIAQRIPVEQLVEPRRDCEPKIYYVLSRYQWVDGPPVYDAIMEYELDDSECPPSVITGVPTIEEPE